MNHQGKVFTGMLLVGLQLSVCGCESAVETPAKPKLTYVEALAIYNQEVAALDRLKIQRQTLQQQLDMPSLGSVSDLLGSAGKVQEELDATLKDLGMAPGRASSDDEKAKKTKGASTKPGSKPGSKPAVEPAEEPAPDPLQQLSSELKAVQAKQDDQRVEVEKEIADLDVQIAEQQTRVDRAKADREAAEASR